MTIRTFHRALAIGAIALAGAALTACAPTTDHSGMPGMTHGASAPATGSVQGTANDADAMFASMMIGHHQQAIDMSDTLLAKTGVDARVTELATRIKAAQAPEIATMRGWLADWGVPSAAPGSMSHGDGMMSEADMAALEAAPGAEAGKLFLQQMIVHHEGAVDMARTEKADGAAPAAVDLAAAIIDAQTAEIAEMKDLLAAL
ncbi:DUF305 domain-containing protein [Microbacterium sp. Au-Mic1]|uniref:DUF305 domain-containing protein n=1 Tax=Microbacterium sp. Au-Mic1 TaxID=2906457 RepID=UPI001E62913C|nr:DUF305 domain-containing protein [Microbacterium sp. Au-Mic1]MCE4026814.1 DUF305 domain-containing protein [Microbacterium sp. Au-Mic1]